MQPFVTVLCVLCAFVVKNPLPAHLPTRKIASDVVKGRDTYRKLHGTPPSPALPYHRNSFSVWVCGDFRDNARRIIPSSGFPLLPSEKKWRDVIKCNHFPAPQPAFTLNTTRRAHLPPARHSTIVIKNSPKTHPPRPNPPTHARM
jgi:hypothetical protein